jgi:S1-C subfamily serine protease
VLWDAGEDIGAAVLQCGVVAPALSISPYSPLIVGDWVTIFGVNAQSGDLDVVVANVESVEDDDSITLSRIAMRGGYEGGPVIDRSGAVVGMLWQSGDDQRQALTPVVVPTTRLLFALEKARHWR